MDPKFLNIFLLFIPTLADQPCQTPNGDFGHCKLLHQCPSLFVHYEHVFVAPEVLEYAKRSFCGSVNEEPKVCCHTRRHVPAKNKTSKTPFVRSDLLPGTDICGISSSNGKGHGETKLDEYPWLALLFYKDEFGSHYGCGGALINERYVLTSAHCASPDLSFVRLGEWNTETNPDCQDSVCAPSHTDIRIQEKIVFPGYVSSQDVARSYNDIALLRLHQKVQFSRFIKPVCLPTTTDEIFKDYMGQTLVIAGWGNTNDGLRSKIKLKLAVNVTRCRLQRDSGQICAGGEENRDSCDGDSGGSLVVTKREENGDLRSYAVGILSFGADPCGQKNKPAVHAKVTKFMYWIVDNLKP